MFTERMRPEELRDAGGLAGTTLGEIAEAVRDVHHAIAGRLFGLVGPAAEPVRLIHDGIAALAYESTVLGVKTVPRAAGLLGSVIRDEAAPSVHDHPRGRVVLGALNGVLGDSIAAEHDSLAPQLRARLHDGQLRRVPSNLAHDARATATGKVIVFVHGLCESDRSWWLGAQKQWGNGDTTYGSMLRAEAMWTPVYVNLNTGRHISDNGHELAWWLGELTREWPVEVREIALVGHSMGGILTRSAAHQGHEAGHAWVDRLTHVIGLGAPHTGAPLERFANWGTHQLARNPETRPLANLINRRSVGIKDLRYGAMLEADWAGADPDELLVDRCGEAALVPGVAYSQVSATLSRDPDGPLPHDLLVTHRSALGQGSTRTIAFDGARALHLGGRHHFDLLSDPAVYHALRDWLDGGEPRTSRASQDKRRRWRRRQAHTD